MLNNKVNITNNIQIFGHHIEITKALESNIYNMIDKLQYKIHNKIHITHAKIILKVDSSNNHAHLQQAEAEIYLSNKKEPIFAKVSRNDMYDALHILKNKLDRQLVKYKEIKVNHHQQPSHEHYNHNNMISKEANDISDIEINDDINAAADDS